MNRRARLSLLGAIAAAAVLAWCVVPRLSRERPIGAAPESHAPAGSAAELAADPTEAAQDARGRTQVIPDAVRYTGRVVDPDDHAIVGATIRVFAASGAVVAETHSDSAGAFAFVAGEGWMKEPPARAVAAGHAEAETVLGATDNEITLRWLTEIHGQVRDATTAKPIARASVFCGQASTTADAEGRYRMGGVAVDDIHVSARAPGYVIGYTSAILRRPEPARIDVELTPCTALSVQVVDRDSGAAISGASVKNGAEALPATDAEGRVTLCATKGMHLYVIVEAPGYAPLFWRWTVAEVPSRASRLPLARWGFVEGRVVDGHGHPLAEVGIDVLEQDHAFSHDDDGPDVLTDAQKESFAAVGKFPRQPMWAYGLMSADAFSTARTDASGTFRVPVVPGAGPLEISATHPEYRFESRRDVLVAAAGAQAWVDFVGARTALIRGRSLHNGKPYQSHVEWRPADGSPAETDVGSTYEIRTLAFGAGTLVLRERSSGEVVRSIDLVVEAGKSYEQDLDWVEELATITGKVSDPSGTVPQDVWIRAHATEGKRRPFMAKLSSDGSYVLRVPPHGVYDVSVFRKSIERRRTGVAAGATGVDFVLPELGRLELRFVDAAGGAPVASRSEYSWGLGWREAGTEEFHRSAEEIDVTGVSRVELPIGVVDLSLDLHGEGYVPRVVTGVAVGARPSAPLTVELERGVALQLRLDAYPPEIAEKHLVFVLRHDQAAAIRGPFPSLDPPANEQINDIFLWLRDPSLMAQLVSCDGGGSAALQGLAPGRYTLRAFPDDLVFEPAAIDVPASAVVEVRCAPR